MSLKIKNPKSQRKTWVTILSEAWKCKSVEEARTWLEKEALLLKRRNPGYTLSGAKFIIKMNLGAIAPKYGEYTVKRIKKLFGVSSPLFGKERNVFL